MEALRAFGLKTFWMLSTVVPLAMTSLPFVGQILLAVVVFLLIYRSDTDITLLFHTKFGTRPEKQFRGKVIWITGASSGIGEQLAYQLAKAGAKLVLSARNAEKLENVKTKCSELSPEDFRDCHMVVPMDLLEECSYAQSVSSVLETFQRIDYLVNNAGMAHSAKAIDTSGDTDNAVMKLNALSTIGFTKAVLPTMLKQQSGCIVNITSLSGKMGSPMSATYSASKQALHGYFDSLRKEVTDDGLYIVNVCPGPVQSGSAAGVLGANQDTPSQNAPQKTTMLLRMVKGFVVSNTTKMDATRCAYLISVAMANHLHEVWISLHPLLTFSYVSQYLPGTTKWLEQRKLIKW